MADVIEVHTDVLFDPSKWIGAHKIYKDVPIEVSNACIAARKIPPIVTAKFPHPTLPVSEFLEVKLPAIYSSPSKYRTKDWFSTDPPNCDAATLWSITSIPPLYFARDLELAFPQKWLNGALSIQDPHNKPFCLPLSAISFYLKIHDLHAAQEKWIESVEWARDEIPDCNPDIFLSVGWNAVHPGAPDGQLDWTRLAGDEWLSGQIIDAMAADIQSRVAAIPDLDACVTVAPLSFQRAIVAVSTQKSPSKYTTRLLQGYKDSVHAGKSRLYFPLHVNGNHWIAFFIDFVRRVFGHGDSRSHAVKFAAGDFNSHLRKWLESSFPGTFTNLGDIMPHAHQLDFIHCGIYFANTTEHAIFRTPIITSHQLCRPLRMHWLQTLHQNARLASGDATPLLTNHNFPDLGPEDFFEQDIPPVPMTSPSAPLIAKLMAVPASSPSPISPSHFQPPSPDPPLLVSPPLPPKNKNKSPISRLTLVEQRKRHCAGTRVNSEKTRKPETNVEYAGGKFSLNHAAHQLKEGLQQSEGLRADTVFQKARYRRWIVSGRTVTWDTGLRLQRALTGALYVPNATVPNLRFRGITALTPLKLGALVIMHSGRRPYLGEVLGIYKYGSISGNHESFTDAETAEGLSYLSLRVYEQLDLVPPRNLFQHISPSLVQQGHSLPLFTHAPISELVYLLTGARMFNVGPELHSISAGDAGWERWVALSSDALAHLFDPNAPVSDAGSDEEDYEEPDAASTSKKRRPKPPRGTIKKAKPAPRPAAKRRAKKAPTKAVVARGSLKGVRK
ncbi:hypothetical protein C8R47DRAFT_1210058 [Mycena vitilis]|nr:hypothetical protein C8R47DRAFT_1210058 [Mycena vitilis]